VNLKDVKAARERLRAAAAGVVFHEGTVALPAEPMTAQQVADLINTSGEGFAEVVDGRVKVTPADGRSLNLTSASDMGHDFLLLRESLDRYLQGSISRMGLKWETPDKVEEAILVRRPR
jgi:hypothetical protein